ncbi:MAG: hypothetical protein OXF98_03845, partial [Rhodospirillaceae bacterium]|nr:hypothetical protein [Rhodospirillaceae bacterium]
MGSGDEAGDLPGVAAPLPALGDHEVEARFLVRHGLLDAAAQGADQPAAALDPVDYLPGRRTQRVDQYPALRVRQRNVDQRQRRGIGGSRQVGLGQGFSLGPFRHAVVAQQAFRELPVPRRHLLPEAPFQRPGFGLLHAFIALGNDHVDAVGIVADPRIDPVEFRRQGFGAHPAGAQHAHAAVVAHRGDDVAAMGEGEDPVVKPESLAQ